MRRIFGRWPRPWEVVIALGVLVGVTTVLSWMTNEEVIGVRVDPPVYEVVLPKEGDGETMPANTGGASERGVE